MIAIQSTVPMLRSAQSVRVMSPVVEPHESAIQSNTYPLPPTALLYLAATILERAVEIEATANVVTNGE